MRRRKLMIGLGALTAGGSAAFGTEAFTSVEAQRNVDVTVAGDQNAFVAIEPLSGDNARKYVDDSGTAVKLELDGNSGGTGNGVSQNAITQIEDLFRVVNQGSQPSSVYFEDSSDAVTFRVTRSTDTSTTGSKGQSLDGANNSVELAVGEQVVVGMTVDTMNSDVSGNFLDSVTLYADASSEAPVSPEDPQPQYVVTNNPSGGNEFDSIQSAVDAADSGAMIGVDGRSTLSPQGKIALGKPNVTLTGYNGRPTIDRSEVTGGTSIEISGQNITLRNLLIDGPSPTEGGPDAIAVTSSGATIENTSIEGFTTQIAFDRSGSNPSNIEIRGNLFRSSNAAIGQTEPLPEDSLTIEDNSFRLVDEGIGLGGEGPDMLNVEGDDEIAQVISDNTFTLSGGHAVGDYTVGTNPPATYQPSYSGDN